MEADILNLVESRELSNVTRVCLTGLSFRLWKDKIYFIEAFAFIDEQFKMIFDLGWLLFHSQLFCCS